MSVYIKLMRPGNCVMGVVGVLVAAFITVGGDLFTPTYFIPALIAALIVFLFMSAGNALNDYCDRDVDKVNHPERPIPSGRISPTRVLKFSYTLFVISIALSVLVNPLLYGSTGGIEALWANYLVPIIIVALCALLMIMYEKRYKARGLPGNVSISLLTGGIFVFGGVAVFTGDFLVLNKVLILGVLAFFATLGREITKDIEDMEGDRGARKTLPMSVGVEKAARLASLSFLLAVAMSPLPLFFSGFGLIYLIVVALADAIFIYGVLILSNNPGKVSKTSKAAMAFALLAFLAGGIL